MKNLVLNFKFFDQANLFLLSFIEKKNILKVLG